MGTGFEAPVLCFVLLRLLVFRGRGEGWVGHTRTDSEPRQPWQPCGPSHQATISRLMGPALCGPEEDKTRGAKFKPDI